MSAMDAVSTYSPKQPIMTTDPPLMKEDMPTSSISCTFLQETKPTTPQATVAKNQLNLDTPVQSSENTPEIKPSENTPIRPSASARPPKNKQTPQRPSEDKVITLSEGTATPIRPSKSTPTEALVETPTRPLEDLEPHPKVARRSPAEEGDMLGKVREARERLQEKKEILRKLNMAKTYRTRWETQNLATLTNQWLVVCQTALEDLRARLKEHYTKESGEQELTLMTLLNHLGIDPKLMNLNEQEDCFNT